MQAVNRRKTAAGISQGVFGIWINIKVTGSRFKENRFAGARRLVHVAARGNKVSTKFNLKFISDRDSAVVKAADY